MITPDLLSRIGAALYGSGWEWRLAVELKIAERRLRRMARGQASIPEALCTDLIALLNNHGDGVTGLLAELQAEP